MKLLVSNPQVKQSKYLKVDIVFKYNKNKVGTFNLRLDK